MPDGRLSAKAIVPPDNWKNLSGLGVYCAEQGEIRMVKGLYKQFIRKEYSHSLI